MSGRPTPRLHRLPVRTDYVLVPAPLDLSLPLVTEKSTLPAIIVTPSSPSSARDFSIAFIQPPPKQSLRDRITNMYYYQGLSTRLRSIIILLLLIFVLLCHLATHQLASAYLPRMEMEQATSNANSGGVMRLKSVQQSFSWSRIMAASPGHARGDIRPSPPAAADDVDILGIAVDADGAGRVEAL